MERIMSRSIQIERSSRSQPCELCSGHEFDIVSRIDRRSDPLSTVACRSCGLVSHESIPSDADVEQYYAHDYRNDYHGEHTPSSHRILRAWEGAQWLLNLLRPYVRQGSRVFEVGAGIGFNVKSFEADGFQAEGIEPGQGFQKYSQDVLRANVKCLSLFDMSPTPQYDFILLVHVIEHFNSPKKALEHIRHLLRPDGRLYVECPNLAEPHAAPGKLFHYAHIYNFTPDTLVAMAEAAGFKTVACLTERHGKALRYVFEKSEPKCEFSSASYGNTIASLRRYNDFTYHARPRYLWQRLKRDMRFASNHILPTLRVHRILNRLQQTSGGGTAPSDTISAGAATYVRAT